MSGRCHHRASQDGDHVIAHGAEIADLGDLEVGVAGHARRVVIRGHLAVGFALLEDLVVGPFCDFAAGWLEYGHALVRVELLLQGHLGRGSLELAGERGVWRDRTGPITSFLKLDAGRQRQDSSRDVGVLGHLQAMCLVDAPLDRWCSYL